MEYYAIDLTRLIEARFRKKFMENQRFLLFLNMLLITIVVAILAACGGATDSPEDTKTEPTNVAEPADVVSENELGGFACGLLCEQDGACPGAMTCSPTPQGFGVCVHS